LLVDAEGNVTQTVPLRCVTPHAKAHNPRSIGVGAIGDFRSRAPSEKQRAAVIATCAALVSKFKLKVDAIAGHDELQGGSADPSKICPGQGLAPATLRAEVAALLSRQDAEMAFVW
jgi:N-acetyl-anhydromuramyl-L-alanine amidase AmpD